MCGDELLSKIRSGAAVTDARSSHERPIRSPSFFQPAAKEPIYKITDEGPLLWLGWFYVEGRYCATATAYAAARIRMIERAHSDALAEDGLQGANTSNAAAQSDVPATSTEAVPLGHSLVAWLAITGVRYHVTPRGREALAQAGNSQPDRAAARSPDSRLRRAAGE